jgi:hypothetical protein
VLACSFDALEFETHKSTVLNQWYNIQADLADLVYCEAVRATSSAPTTPAMVLNLDGTMYLSVSSASMQ